MTRSLTTLLALSMMAGSATLAFAQPIVLPPQAAAPILSPYPTPTPGGAYVPDMTPITVPPPLTLPPPINVPPDVPVRPLTMDEAVGIALRHQPNIDIAAANVDAARGRVVQARVGLNPTVTLTSDYTAVSTQLGGKASGGGSSANSASSVAASGNGAQSSGAQSGGGQGQQQSSSGGGGGGGNTGLSTTVTARQLIFDFEHTRNLLREAQEIQQQFQATLTQTQSDFVLSVKQAFVTYVQDQHLIQVQQVNVRDQQEHLRQAAGLYRAGTGLPSDVVRAQAAVADAINSLVSAQNTSDTARINLARLMGIDPRTPLVTTPSIEPEIDDSDVQRLIDIGLVIRPEVLEAQALIRADQFGLSAAHTTSAPALAGTASISRIPAGNDDINLLTAGLSLNWPFVDGGLTKAQVIQAQAALQAAQDQLRIARSTTISDITTSYLTLHTALQRLADVAVEVRSGQEALRLQSGRYGAGLGTSLDVLDAEATLVTALTNQVNAQADVDNARASLLHAVGSPPPPVPPLKPDQQQKAPPAPPDPPPPFPIPSPIPTQAPVVTPDVEIKMPVLPGVPPVPPPNGTNPLPTVPPPPHRQ